MRKCPYCGTENRPEAFRCKNEDCLSILPPLSEEENNKKPNGTIRYYDQNGIIQERWVPPELIEEWKKQGKAKPVHKVLIKGFWRGVKEDFWDLPEEDVKKFADEKGIVYAICVYENGEPKYSLVSKKFWLKSEEIGEILNDPNLLVEQKNGKIKKIITG